MKILASIWFITVLGLGLAELAEARNLVKAASWFLRRPIVARLLRNIMTLAVAVSCATPNHAAVRVEKSEYKGWKN